VKQSQLSKPTQHTEKEHGENAMQVQKQMSHTEKEPGESVKQSQLSRLMPLTEKGHGARSKDFIHIDKILKVSVAVEF